MKTKETDSGERFDEGRRKLILGALTLPLTGLVARASAGEAEDLAARVEALVRPLVGRLGFSAQRLDGGPVIAVFMKSSSTPVADRDRAIAETARSLYDHFST